MLPSELTNTVMPLNISLCTLIGMKQISRPQLPATASNVCTIDARLGGVGRVPPPHQKCWLRPPTGLVPPCNIWQAFIFMCDCLPSLQSYCILAIFAWSSPSSLLLHLHSWHLLGGILPFLPSFLNTCPYHLIPIFLRKVVTGSTLASLQMCSLLVWFFWSCF